ncbi:MAG: metallophosphoesterase [Desulfobacterales bacterium]|nr:metallophosphoesterase [Desulfobacterales bacterium]MBF0398446.1 metallophosphoesterase [Desulfobacterales bacterium]
MAIVFLFFSIHIFFDLYKIKFTLNDKTSFIITIVMIIVILIYGRIEAENINIKEISIKTKKFPKHIESVKIAQISDVHFSIINGAKKAQKIADILKKVNPDMLLSTGDLIDRGMQEKSEIIKILSQIKTKYGNYAVTGNHEFYSGLQYSKDFTEKGGFKLLRNEYLTINNVLTLVGIDDETGKRFNIAPSISEIELFNSIPKELPIIVIKHQPKVDVSSDGAFDLQLSGHTHNGQIFPFRFITKLFFKYNNGLYGLFQNSFIYVTAGTGTWGPPIRFLSQPEIVIINLCKTLEAQNG